jgi:predicted kinase
MLLFFFFLLFILVENNAERMSNKVEMDHEMNIDVLQNASRHTGAIPRRIESNNNLNLPSNYKEMLERYFRGEQVCVILRGLPGAGKSTLARQIVQDTVKENASNHIISADDFFYNNKGKYMFDASKLEEAHNAAQRKFCKQASLGYSPLIVDNTNVKYWELFHYLQVASEKKYYIMTMEPATTWKFNVEKLAQKTLHSVPREKIKNMKDKYDRELDIREIIKAANISYNENDILTRKFPYYNPFKETYLPTISTSSDVNANELTKKDKSNTETFEWTSFQQSLKKIDEAKQLADIFKWPEPTTNNGLQKYETPPQVFDDKWETNDDDSKLMTNNLATAKDKPQPQRRPQQQQRKSKKISPQTLSTNELKPHKKDCRFENERFMKLRELYPNVKDTYLWDLFVNCNGNLEYTVDLLCEENRTEIMDGGNELNCDCSNEENGLQRKKMKENVSNNNNNNINNINNVSGSAKKQTPVKSKKNKDTALKEDLKMAIEESIKIGE